MKNPFAYLATIPPGIRMFHVIPSTTFGVTIVALRLVQLHGHIWPLMLLIGANIAMGSGCTMWTLRHIRERDVTSWVTITAMIIAAHAVMIFFAT